MTNLPSGTKAVVYVSNDTMTMWRWFTTFSLKELETWWLELKLTDARMKNPAQFLRSLKRGSVREIRDADPFWDLEEEARDRLVKLHLGNEMTLPVLELGPHPIWQPLTPEQEQADDASIC